MSKIKTIALFLILFSTHLSFGQITFPEPGIVFSDVTVPRIDIFLPTDSLNAILAPENEESNYHYHATFIFNNNEEIDTIENIGFRLRGNTSRHAAKKSFKISFNTYESGRKFHGLEKMNLNGEHNDPSIMRSKIAWDLARQMGIPGSRSNHVRLFVNDVFFGIYINVEHIDEEFVDKRFGNKNGNLYKCTYPANLDYLGQNPDDYKVEFFGKRPYELITNTELDDYSDLAHFIDILNNTPSDELVCELEEIFDVPSYLRAMAFDLLIGNWDGPLFNINNFYLYHNPITQKFYYIPNDLDNTFGIDWFGIDWGSRDIYNWPNDWSPHPLYWNLMAVEKYRELFNYYMIQYMEMPFHPNYLFPRIDELKSHINSYVPSDPYYPLDYGFTFSDFLASFTEALPFDHTRYGLEPFVTTRRFWTAQQLDDEDIHPIFFDVNHNYPAIGEDLFVSAKVVDTDPISTVEICYKTNAVTEFTCIQLQDDGQGSDEVANDGIYNGMISVVNQMEHIQYYIIAKDVTNLESQYPGCGLKDVFIGTPPIPLYINEIMASNESTIADEAGEYDDWVELYYAGNTPVNLGDKYLSDDEDNPTKWRISEQWLIPQSYQLIWLDKDEEQGAFHSNFKLSSAGEFIGIFDNESHGYALIDGFSFGQQTTDIAYGRVPNGTGPLDFIAPTPGESNTPLTNQQTDPNPSIFIYPNPFNQQLNIRFKNKGNHAFQWRIIDISGQVISHQKVNSSANTTLIPTKHLPSGIYFLTVVLENGRQWTQKLVK